MKSFRTVLWDLNWRVFTYSAIFVALIFYSDLTLSTAAQSLNETFPITLVVNTGHNSEVDDASFSPDGRFALTRQGGIAKMWDPTTGRLLRTISSPKEGSNFNISQGSRLAAFERFNEGVDIVDLYTGNVSKALTLSSSSSMALNADGSRLLTSGDKLEVWDIGTGTILRAFAFPKKRFSRSMFLPGGREILSALDDDTVAVWNAETFELIRRTPIRIAPAPKDKFRDRRTFSPRGNLLALSGFEIKSTSIIDTSTGTVVATLPHEDSAIAFSSDGTMLASASEKQLKIWNVATGKLMRSAKLGSNPRVLALSPDGMDVLTCDDDKQVRFWDVATLKQKNTVAPNGGDAFKVMPSPDGKFILSGSGKPGASPGFTPSSKPTEKTVRLWDVETGRLVRSFAGHSTWLEPIAFSPDGAHVLTANLTNIKIWETTTGKLLRDFNSGHSAEISTIAYAANGRWYVTEDGYGKSMKIWNAETNKLQRTLPDSENPQNLTVSPDSRRVALGSAGRWIKIANIDAGGFQKTLIGHSEHVSSVAFSPNNTNLASASGDKTLRIWDVASGRTLQTLRGHASLVNSVAYDDTGNLLVSASADTTFKIWDAATGTVQRTYSGHVGKVNDARFIKSGRQIVSAGDDGTLRVWDAKRTELLLTIVGFSNDEWVSITPEGFFDASSDKASQLLTLVRGLEWYSVEQVYQALYRPDLVREKLAGDTRGLVREAAARLDLDKVLATGNAPVALVVSPVDGTQAAPLQVTAQSDITVRDGGVGRVEWRLNGVTVGIETPPATAAGQQIRLSRNLTLDPGNNTIEVVAYNGANLVASVPARTTVTTVVASTSPGAAAPQQSRLFVIAAGINDYSDNRFKLGGSVRDAQALSKALADSGKSLYRSVEVKLLTDADVTKDKLDSAFRAFSSQASPSDVFLLYLAGHGKTVDGRYYFVPRDFKVGQDADEKAINAAVIAQGIPQEQWQRWFATIPARKSMILFDTCESGTLTGDVAQTKAIEQSAANDRLAQATGRSIITASSGTQVAFEGYRGHGLFTYNLLDALERADSDGNGTIEINELAAYVYAQVTTLSEQVFKTRQEPQIRIASSYPLTKQGRVLAGDLPVIALDSTSTFQLAQTADLQIKPANGATVVRSLNAKTVVTVIKSEGGWSLIASGGKPVGYVATRDLVSTR